MVEHCGEGEHEVDLAEPSGVPVREVVGERTAISVFSPKSVFQTVKQITWQ